MRVAVLVLEGMFDTGLSVVLDTLSIANELGVQARAGASFEVDLVSVRSRVRTQQGLTIPARNVETVAVPDLVVLPALGDKTPAGLGTALRRRDVADAGRQLIDWHEQGARLAAACTGTYVMAATGLLDGLRATTSWWLGPDFRQRFPSVSLDDTQMIVAQAGRITAGAALAHVDLALWLIRERSPTLARTTSSYLLFDGRPSQAQYAMADHLAHSDPLVERFERWAREHLSDFSMAAAARAVGASPRTLERRLRKAIGRTPIAFVGDLRVEQALYRLETSDDSVEDIAAAVGYQDGVTLRTLLRRRTGRGIRELRGRPGHSQLRQGAAAMTGPQL